MKKFVGLILILASVLLSSVSNLHAGSYDSYLAIIGKSGKPSPAQKLAAINQLITNGADQNNNVILDLLANKILDLKYHELIKLDLSAKLAQILNKLPELSSASDSSSAPTVASSSPASFSGAPSLPSSSGGSALDKYVSEPKDNDALFLILTNPEDLLNVVIVDYLINRLKLKNYSDLIEMRLYGKGVLLLNLISPGAGAGAGSDVVASATLTREQQEEAYFDSFVAPGSVAINNITFYKTLQNDHATPEEIINQKIMAALFAPQKVTNELMYDRDIITPEMGISNEDVLNFLLKDRFNQNPETVRQMILQDKQIGVVRFLLPYAIRQREILPKTTGGLGYVEYPSPPDAEEGLKDVIVTKFGHPSETLRNSYRHLDFQPYSGTLWLVNRHKRNGYDYLANLPSYINVSSFYWMPDGETFILIYNDGKSGTYRGVDGALVGELREPIIMEAPSATEAPTGFNERGQPTGANGETARHFGARLRAKLNEFEARSIAGRDPALIRAMAILTLDKSFTGLTDDNVTSFENISEDDGLLTSKLDEISAKDPNSLTLLDKAIVYYAIKQAKIPADNSLFEKWNEIFNAMDLAVIAGQNTQGASGIPSDVITNHIQLADFVGQAIVKYPLNETEKEQLGRPVSYTNKTAISELIAKNPESASNLDKAKAFFLIKANIVKSIDKAKQTDPEVVKWRSVLNI